jgi:hypothetical protein
MVKRDASGWYLFSSTSFIILDESQAPGTMGDLGTTEWPTRRAAARMMISTPSQFNRVAPLAPNGSRFEAKRMAVLGLLLHTEAICANGSRAQEELAARRH